MNSKNLVLLVFQGCLLVLGIVASIPDSFAQNVQSRASFPKESTEVFLLRQLIEIQTVLRRLTTEIAALRKSVDGIKQVRATPPVAPQRPAAPAASGPTDLTVEKNDPKLGASTAKVAVVEFSDFQCPFCSRFHRQTFPGLKQQYIDTGKIQYVVRDFPLGFHPEARMAALAANCAGKQDAFWGMQDKLFSNQRGLGDAMYQQLAKELSLDMPRFNTCLGDGAVTAEVNADLSYGQSVGVRGTPTFFVGRLQDGRVVDAKKIVGAQPLTAFSRAIDALLKVN